MVVVVGLAFLEGCTSGSACGREGEGLLLSAAMDSGNSGSLQSSSGGDDDFDSRGGGVDSSPLSALLRPTPSPSSAGAFSMHGSLYGLQDFTSASPQQQQQQLQHQHHHHQQQQASWSAQFMAGPASSSTRVAPPDAGMGASAHQAPDPSAAAAAAPPRGSRKRARASRRAPTTVLTTDTSNFRAMVQEFTGIPNPPFAAGAGGPGASFNSRFDHIFSSSALRSAAGGAGDPASSLPPYLLRPFAQKLQTATSPFAPFTSPSSSTPPGPSSNMGIANANARAAATAAATTTASANHRGVAGDDFQLTSSALLRMQDHSSNYLSFQNLLGSTQPSSQHMFGGLSHGAPRLHEQSPSEFMPGAGSGSMGLSHGGMMVSEGMHMHQQQRSDVHQGGDELSGVVRAGASGSGGGGGGGHGSCKLNYPPHTVASSSSAAASTDMTPDGGSRSGRGEGLDPWLCTSE